MVSKKKPAPKTPARGGKKPTAVTKPTAKPSRPPRKAQAASPSSTEQTPAKATTPPSSQAAAAAPPAELRGKPLFSTVNQGLASSLKKEMSQAAASQAPHLIIEARAGTGKTTTLVEGLKKVLGVGESCITPSPQQAAIWEAMCLGPKPKTVCFAAFNSSIAGELKSRVPPGCDAMTMHSMGNRAVTQAFGRQSPEKWVVRDIAEGLLKKRGMDCSSPAGRAKLITVLGATDDLVKLCKANLLVGTVEDLDELTDYYEIELNGSKELVYELVPEVLEACKRPRGQIMFDDMIWLPVVLGLPLQKYDLLLVDEAQDLNRCQQALARKASRRLILCGDPKQAIYGFAGADCKSMGRMAEELTGESHGCQTLPLTVTRRCGKAIVQEAKKYVLDFEAHESNPEGKISSARYPEQKTSGQNSGGVRESRPLRPTEVNYQSLVVEGDFLLCRVNAPLVSQCFQFLKQGRKATIQGRDVGRGLISTIKKTKATTVVELSAGLDRWLTLETEKEQAKKHPNEQRLIGFQDRHDCLCCFMEGCETVEQVIHKIEDVFTDDKSAPGIRLSSIHKAKGLEAKRVFFLRPEGAGCPHPMAKSPWEREQELNLCYVAITRAIEELVFVS